MPATGDPVRLDGAPSDLADGVLEALYGLKGRRRGRGDEWVPECLVAAYRADHPGTLRAEAVRAVLTDVLDLLALESTDHADLLKGRFWEGLSVEQMVEAERPRPWQDRNFQNRQRRAVERLAELLWEKESWCLAVRRMAEEGSGGDRGAVAAPGVVPIAPEVISTVPGVVPDAPGVVSEVPGVAPNVPGMRVVDARPRSDGSLRRVGGVVAIGLGVLAVVLVGWPAGWIGGSVGVPVTSPSPLASVSPAATSSASAASMSSAVSPGAGTALPSVAAGCGEAARVAAPAVPRRCCAARG